MTVDDCILCSLCNEGDARYAETYNERESPRHTMWNLKRRRDTPIYYRFLLNGLAEAKCPVGVRMDAAVIDARRNLVKKGMTTKANAEMVEKMKNGKNPYK